jgi:acetyl esterase/lipase
MVTRAASVVLDQVTASVVAAARRPPYLYQVGVADGRAALAEIQSPAQTPADIDHRTVLVQSGYGPIVTHLVRCTDAPATTSAVLYAHGGGWTMGGYETHARFAQRLARGTGAAVVVPDYALAPEHRYPVAVEQFGALLGWLDSGADALLDIDRVVLVGDCAGATILASLMTQRPDLLPALPISALVLLYPISEPAAGDQSMTWFAEGYGLRLADVRHLWRQYAPRPATRAQAACDALNHDPVAPASLPPTLVITAEADVTRDRAERFADRLRVAGAPVTAVRYLGTIHDFAVLDLLRDSPSARGATAQALSFLSTALHPDPTGRGGS